MHDCPELVDLRALEAGSLADAHADVLLAHVAGCVHCRELLGRLQHADLDGRILRRAMRDASAEERSAASAPGGASKESWTIPDYTCEHLCGEGAFGTVWAVRDRVGVFRALKVIDLARVSSGDAKCRELAALEVYCRQVEPHPNLIRVHHVGMHGEKLYYTMDLADDDITRRPVRETLPERYRALTLRHVIHGQPISPEAAIEVVLRLLRGLARLHCVGLAHRDIKPANIVFVDRQPKLSDIGMITTAAGTPSHVGTPKYMPPDGCMDLTADTYALGRVLHELLAGPEAARFPQLPAFVHDSAAGWDTRQVEAVIRRACGEKAGARFATADRMREELEGCREWSYDALFNYGEKRPAKREGLAVHSLVPLGVAALNALPWVLGFVLVLVLIWRMT
jgi:hypothetical protein